MKKKEEILTAYKSIYVGKNDICGIKEDIFNAMEEYAQYKVNELNKSDVSGNERFQRK